ncbi:unnamed protein product [Dicrocoelium dendriticum]|nr:unnamed protein product [Dicrocoelium dendriticum]
MVIENFPRIPDHAAGSYCVSDTIQTSKSAWNSITADVVGIATISTHCRIAKKNAKESSTAKSTKWCKIIKQNHCALLWFTD